MLSKIYHNSHSLTPHPSLTAPRPNQGINWGVQVHLIAVQTRLEPAHYRSREAFRERILQLAKEAVEDLPPGEPRVVAFPEAIALPLVFWLDTPEETLTHKNAMQAALTMLRSQWQEALSLVGQGVFSPSVFFHLRAPAVWPVYQETFVEAAKTAKAYVIAGSLFSPLMDWEPSQKLHREGRGVYNLSLVVSPGGTVLGRVPKVNLTKDEKASFLSAGQLGQQIVHTQIGILSNLICLDAFHDLLIEQADAAGAWLVVQPSANAAKWDGPWGSDPSQIEGEVWLREGLAKKLAGRENLRYGINPMLSGELYELEFEGRSGIYAASKALALAQRPTGDEIVRVKVEVEDDSG